MPAPANSPCCCPPCLHTPLPCLSRPRLPSWRRSCQSFASSSSHNSSSQQQQRRRREGGHPQRARTVQWQLMAQQWRQRGAARARRERRSAAGRLLVRLCDWGVIRWGLGLMLRCCDTVSCLCVACCAACSCCPGSDTRSAAYMHHLAIPPSVLMLHLCSLPCTDNCVCLPACVHAITNTNSRASSSWQQWVRAQKAKTAAAASRCRRCQGRPPAASSCWRRSAGRLSPSHCA